MVRYSSPQNIQEPFRPSLRASAWETKAEAATYLLSASLVKGTPQILASAQLRFWMLWMWSFHESRQRGQSIANCEKCTLGQRAAQVYLWRESLFRKADYLSLGSPKFHIQGKLSTDSSCGGDQSLLHSLPWCFHFTCWATLAVVWWMKWTNHCDSKEHSVWGWTRCKWS